jgi:hypothetical protein
MANLGAVDIAPLLALDQAIADIRQALKADEPLDIKVTNVTGVTGICPQCKARIQSDRYQLS